MEKLTPEQRHKTMAAIHSKDTKPELMVRRGLWRQGFRYRLNSPRLPGHPDLVLRKYRTCVFVNGCFWHGHGAVLDGETAITHNSCCAIPTTNRPFWIAKIRRNQERDKRVQQQLAEMGWHCITVWECELTPLRRDVTLKALAHTLNTIWMNDHSVKRPYLSLEEEDTPIPMAAEDCNNE